MAPPRLALALLHVATLLAPPARPASGFDTVVLRPRGWPQVECELYPQQTLPDADEGHVDFWLRGWFSRQFYRCRLDAPEDVRSRLLAADRGEHLLLAGRWRIIVDKFRRPHWLYHYPLMGATSTPRFACLGRDTDLPAAIFPLEARLVGAQWRKCFPVADDYHGERFFADDGLVTISFRGEPTLVCGTSRQTTLAPLPVGAILPEPYKCFFATSLDFPSLSDPQIDVFKRVVMDKFIPPSCFQFRPFQCWLAADDSYRPFDFDVFFDGKHAHRCLFQGESPSCAKGQVSTVAPTLESSSVDLTTTIKDSIPSTLHTSLESLFVSERSFSGTDEISNGVTTQSFTLSESDNTVYQLSLF